MTERARIEVRTKDNSTHTRNAYVGIDQRREFPGREGITQALEHIVSSALPSFFRRAYRVLGNTADAEDAVQDAIIAAYTHLDQFRGQSQMSTWLTSIVLNCARMQLRMRRRHIDLPLDEPTGESQTLSISERVADCRPNPEDECRTSELRTYLSYFHSQLSPVLRKAFQLRDIEGLSIRETAKILGIPSGTVKARSARARKKIQELMGRALGLRSRRLTNRVLGFDNSGRSSPRSRALSLRDSSAHQPLTQEITRM